MDSLKENLLGSVADDSEVLVPNFEHMKLMLIEDIVMVAFCKQCGSYHGLRYPEVEKLLLAMDQPLVDLEKKYFTFSSCSICEEGEREIELNLFKY